MKYFFLVGFFTCVQVIAATKYSAAGAKVQSDGTLCIFEETKDASGEIIDCSEDSVSGAKAKELNKLVGSYPSAVLDSFLNGRPKSESGGHKFKIADLESFLRNAKGNPSCGSAIKSYNLRKKQFKEQMKKLEENMNSNEQSLTSSCSESSPNSSTPEDSKNPGSSR